MPAGRSSGQVPVVTAILRSGTVELTLANEGQQEVTYTLTPNDFKGHTQTVAVKSGKSKTIGWPTDQDGYYDVVITATSAGGFRRATRAASPDRQHRRGAWDPRAPGRHMPPRFRDVTGKASCLTHPPRQKQTDCQCP